jgi:pyruvate,water dikinase
MGDADLRRFMDHVVVTGNAFMEPDLAIFVVKSACIWMLEELLRLCGLPPTELQALTAGLSGNVTLALGQAVAELAGAIAREPSLRGAWEDEDPVVLVHALARYPSLQKHCEAFMNKFGHVTTTWDIRIPTWQEAPQTLVHLLKKTGTGQREKARQLEDMRLAAQQRLFGRLADWPEALAFTEELLETLYQFMRYDEDHHMQSSRLFPPSRRVFAELARRLMARGVLREEDEIYFLSQGEVEAIFASERPFPLWYLAARRRESFRRAWHEVPPKAYLGDRPVSSTAVTLDPQSDLVGVAASSGRAKGRVRHVSSPEQLQDFQPGDILVTRSPNPAWTPLFATAGALVTASGSALSHGFISAREYALPAVSGIAIEALSEGKLIEVDGFAGTVRRLDETGVDGDHDAVV